MPHRDLSTHCPLPWRHLLIANDGTVAPCCVSQHRYADANGRPYIMHRDSIESVWNGDDIRELRRALSAGERPAACDDCWIKEARGLTSHRLKMMRVAEQEHSAYYGIDWSQPAASTVPVNMTVRYGNICNLKCRICVPDASSRWIEEWNHAHGGDWLADKVREHAALGNDLRREEISDWPRAATGFWTQFKALLPHMRELTFSGGEPLMIPKQLEMLRWCAESGHAGHIDLQFHTNGTVMTDELLWTVLPRFRSVLLQFSIDGTGEQFEYQRHGASWLEVESNVRAALAALGSDHGPRGQAVVNLTVNAYNVLYLHRYGQWFDQLGITVGLNHLVGNPDLDPANLPREVRENIADILESSQSEQPVRCYQWGSSYDEIVAALRGEPRREDVVPFITATNRMDAWRGESFTQVFPELARVLGM